MNQRTVTREEIVQNEVALKLGLLIIENANLKADLLVAKQVGTEKSPKDDKG